MSGNAVNPTLDCTMESLLYIFAYGSNLCTRRFRARTASATPLVTGYVTHRRLTFHKRGQDGSAKADAAYSGLADDRVWGVVFSLAREEMSRLDECERGYDQKRVTVAFGNGEVHEAITYLARDEWIDTSLAPFSWYHRYVVEGAVEHRLPLDYVQLLKTIETIADPDCERHARNSGLTL